MEKRYTLEDRDGTLYVVLHDEFQRLWFETKLETVKTVRNYGQAVLGSVVEKKLAGYFGAIIGKRVGIPMKSGIASFREVVEPLEVVDE